ncbi:MAG: substrate-binding domain-containing protein [Actinomycetota bacterium]|nr:substrate-binding domain-containing protein [Actinomycetota bacterium]
MIARETRRPDRKRKSRSAALAVAALGFGGLLAACGSTSASSTTTSTAPSNSTSGSSAGLAQAQQIVNTAMAPPPWQGPTAKVDTSHLSGKSVWIVNLTEEIPALNEWAAVAQADLQRAHVNVQICDAKGTPEGITSCLQQAIAAKPAVLVALALDTTYIHSYIQQADAAGIKVITAQTGTPGTPQGTGAVAEVTFNYPEVGKILGAWFAASSKCTGYPQIITSTSSRQPSAAEVAGMQQELAQACPNSKPLPVVNSLIPDWGTTLASTTRSLLTANPNLKYMLPLYDGMTIYMVPAIQQMGLSSKVQVGSFNATPVVMQNELAKPSALAADVGGPNQWYGDALADETFRVLAGATVVPSENVPLRLFTRANVNSINVNANESTWYGSVNYNCNYDKLWGMSCN